MDDDNKIIIDSSKHNFPIDKSKISKHFLEKFEIKNVEFKVDEFEELILQDVMRFDENTRVKLSRDMTSTFSNWMKNKIEKKENIAISIKGNMRCLVGDTLVLGVDFTEKKIKDCKQGDFIFTYNEKTFEVEIKPILKLWENGFKEIYELTLIGGQKIKCSKNHKFLKGYTQQIYKGKRKGNISFFKREFERYDWTELNDLKKGDLVGVFPSLINFEKKKKDKDYSIHKIYEKNNIKFKRIKDIKFLGKEKVYDLTLKDNHNYCANNFLVKNSGKSLITLKFTNNNVKYYNKPFDTNYIVCANQKEYRQKLSKASFGDVFQIDENAFANVGEGSMTETHQLKDIQNIIAKQNIHTYYITPKVFLSNNAELGLAYWGKDVNNWCSRFLLYSLKNENPILMGYVIINVGSLFNDYGCFFNKILGGCTNPSRLRLDKISENKLHFTNIQDINNLVKQDFPIEYLKNSSCIPGHKTLKEIKNLNLEKIDDEKTPCPFYRICKHPLNTYERKKDEWISREMSGGMDERSLERFRVALELIKKVGFYSVEQNRFMIKAKGKSDLKIKTELYLPKLSNTKFTGTEKETIINTIQSLGDVEVFEETCKNLKLNYIEELKEIENGELLIENLDTKTEDFKEYISIKEKLYKDILLLVKNKSLTEKELNSKIKLLVT